MVRHEKGLEVQPQHHAKILSEPWAPLFSWLQEYVKETWLVQ
jgi:hypothetical protein